EAEARRAQTTALAGRGAAPGDCHRRPHARSQRHLPAANERERAGTLAGRSTSRLRDPVEVAAEHSGSHQNGDLQRILAWAANKPGNRCYLLTCAPRPGQFNSRSFLQKEPIGPIEPRSDGGSPEESGQSSASVAELPQREFMRGANTKLTVKEAEFAR